ncbi:MAG: hypothetical protein GTO41_09765, partial [Burkholderiales bacterium]|nr:hypothetical protein [Burkholderiales bacterium]
MLDNAEVRDVCVLRRADLPQGSPNLMHVTVCNDKQIGSLTLSYANGNASASVAYFLEGGTINVDLRGFTFTAQYGTGPQSLVRRFKSGMVAAAAIGMGTAAMLASRLIGRTTANPGIGGLITN